MEWRNVEENCSRNMFSPHKTQKTNWTDSYKKERKNFLKTEKEEQDLKKKERTIFDRYTKQEKTEFVKIAVFEGKNEPRQDRKRTNFSKNWFLHLTKLKEQLLTKQKVDILSSETTNFDRTVASCFSTKDRKQKQQLLTNQNELEQELFYE